MLNKKETKPVTCKSNRHENQTAHIVQYHGIYSYISAQFGPVIPQTYRISQYSTICKQLRTPIQLNKNYCCIIVALHDSVFSQHLPDYCRMSNRWRAPSPLSSPLPTRKCRPPSMPCRVDRRVHRPPLRCRRRPCHVRCRTAGCRPAAASPGRLAHPAAEVDAAKSRKNCTDYGCCCRRRCHCCGYCCRSCSLFFFCL